MAGRTSFTLSEGMTGISENAFLDIKNNSFSVTADVEIPAGGGQGASSCRVAGSEGGALYMKEGVPAFHYNFLDRERFTIEGGQALPPGAATIRFEFNYDGGGPGRGGTGKIFVDDKLTGEGRIGRTQPLLFSADETADVGIDLQTPVVEALGAGEDNRFTGRIPRVTIALTSTP